MISPGNCYKMMRGRKNIYKMMGARTPPKWFGIFLYFFGGFCMFLLVLGGCLVSF